MRPFPVRLSRVVLDLATAFAESPVPPPAAMLLTQLDTSGAMVHGYRVTHTADGRVVQLHPSPELTGGLTVAVTGIDAFDVVIGLADGASLEVAEPGPHVRYCEIRGLGIGVRFDPALLRPVDGGQRAMLSWTGSVRWYPDWRVQLVGDPELSLSACEIVGTGIIVELEGVQVDFSGDSSPAGIRALGLGPEFRGVFARSGFLQVLPQARFGPDGGLRVDISDLAVGSLGITGSVGAYFGLSHDDGVLNPANAFTGELFDSGWQLGISAVEVALRNNAVQHFMVAGMLRVPLLNTLFDVRFGMQQSGGSYLTTIHLGSVEPVEITVGHGTIAFETFTLDGEVGPDGFGVAGGASGIAVDLAPLNAAAGYAGFALSRRGAADELRIELREVPLGPLGTVDRAELVLRDSTIDGAQVTELSVEAQVSWTALRQRLDVPAGFPALPDDGLVTARLSWREDSTGRVMILRLTTDLPDVDALWSFLPPAWRPEVTAFQFGFEATFPDTASFENASTDDSLTGRIFADLDVRLPDLSGIPFSDLVSVSTGNDEGLIHARLEVATVAGVPSLSFEVLNPFSVALGVPGFEGSEPPMRASITRVAVDASVDDTPTGTFSLSGDFAIAPFVLPASAPLAAPLEGLFRHVDLDPPVGTAEFRLAVSGSAAELVLEAELTSGGIELDVLGMLGDLTRGIVAPPGTEGATVPLGIDAGFDLKRVALRLGSLDGSLDPAAEQFSFELILELRFAGLPPVPVTFRVSDRELSFGIVELQIPLRTPEFPLVPADLAGLSTDAAWVQRFGELETSLALLVGDDATLDEARRTLQAKQFLLEVIYEVRSRLAGPPNAAAYDTMVGFTVTSLSVATALLHFDTGLTLAISDALVVIPFGDPRGIRVEGTAELTGFPDSTSADGDGSLQFTLGLSAEMIYLSLQTDGRIELPTLGPYSGSSLEIGALTIGYGYTRNSLAVVVNGELVLPDALIEDLDTSELGAGIRMPKHNRLGVKLDLIPVVLGPVDFVMPLFEFDLDLRTPNAPPFVSTAPAQPFWDGLELIVPGLFHDAVKRVAFSPFFGILPIDNVRFDADLEIGDEATGVTVIADDVLILLGLPSVPKLPIPLFASPAEPFYENLCLNVRLAGFGINANLQRPFPSFSPFALFESLGLISDPSMPIDPGGSLANTIRVSITDAVVTLPERVLRIFPDAAAINRKPVHLTVNLGTFITALQQIWSIVGHVGDAVVDAAQDVNAAVAELVSNPPDLSVSALLSMLPPELRKFRTGADFAGFDATAVVLILDAGDAAAWRAEMQRRDTPAAPAPPGLTWGSAADPDALARFRPTYRAGRVRSVGRMVHPDEPSESLFSGIEFRGFGVADLDEIPRPDRPTAGVIVGAHVKVFAGQRVRFLGALFEDGSFSMVSTAEVRPVHITVAGVPVSLPLKVSGRLALTGRSKRDGYHGSIDAAVHCSWNVIPGVLRLRIGSADKPASVSIRSGGHFTLRSDAEMTLFNVLTIRGAVDADQSHCMISADLTYRAGQTPGAPNVPLIDLAVGVRGRIGPGAVFNVAGGGSLRILGHALSKVSAAVDNAGVQVEGKLHTGRWRLGNTNVPCELDLAVRGSIDVRKRTKPAFALSGSGSLKILGAGIEGSAALTANCGALTTELSGRLTWQGREWLQGSIRVGPDGLQISGRTSFAIDLTPSQLGSTKVASLFFRIELGGTFTLDSAAGLAGFSIKGDAVLGARLARSDDPNRDQIFPLAMQSFDTSGDADLALPLMKVDGFQLIPAWDLGDLTIPVPVLTPSDTQPLHLKTTPIHDDDNYRVRLRWDGDTLLPVTVQVPGFPDIVVPDIRVNEPFNYPIPVNWESSHINIHLPLTTQFDLALVWYQKSLAVRVSRANGRIQHWKLSSAF